MAVITPILKKPSLCVKQSQETSAPFRNLPFLGKVIEKVVAAQLSLSPVRFTASMTPCSQPTGPGHSTETALLRIQDDINRGPGCWGRQSCLFSWISQRPFDTIDPHHPAGASWRLWLASEGLRWPWLRSLSPWTGTQSVIINGGPVKPLWISVLGFPQGVGPWAPYSSWCMSYLCVSVIGRHPGVHHHGYADDRQLYTQFKPTRCGTATGIAFATAGDVCGGGQGSGCSPTSLRSTAIRTEFMVITTPHYQTTYRALQPSCERWWDQSACSVLPPATSASSWDSTMGHAWPDPEASGAPCFHHPAHRQQHQDAYLDRDTCVKAVLSLVMSRVDYCNSLLVGQSAAALRGLQLAQNYAARLVMGLRRRDHVTPALQALHWLPIHQRVCYKLMCLLHKTLYTDDAPVYMSSMVSQCHYAPGCTLHPSGLCRPLLLGVGSCSLECAASSPPSLFNAQDF